MPRIAATLGVFGLVVLALGLNMAQFPIEYRGAAPMANSPDTKSEVATTDQACVPVASLRPPDQEAQPHLQEQVDELVKIDKQVKVREQTKMREQVKIDEQTTMREQINEQESERAEEATESEGATEQFGRSIPGASKMSEAVPVCNRQFEVADKGQESSSQPQAESPAEATQEASSGPSDRALGPGLEFGPGYGGVYNPLEPWGESGPGCPPVLTQPSSVASLDLVAPSVAFPNPAYADESLPNATEGRGLVTIERDKDAIPPASADQVVRLPSVDNVWPGKPASQPSTLGWYPADGYPATHVSQ